MNRRIPGPARELLVSMFANAAPREHSIQMDVLVRRGFARRSGTSVTAERARVTYTLTPRGIQIAEQLTRNKIGHGLCWDV